MLQCTHLAHCNIGQRSFCVLSSSFRLISSIVTLLLLVALIGVTLLALRNPAYPAAAVATNQVQPTVANAPTQLPALALTPTPAPTLTLPTPPTLPTLGEITRVAEGGFIFQPLINYTLEQAGGSVNLHMGDAGQETAFLLRGGHPRDFAQSSSGKLTDLFSQFIAFYAQQDNFQVSATD